MKIYEKYLNENKEFMKVKKELTDELMQWTDSGEYDIKKIKKLMNINDPKKFITAYKRLTGAGKYDLPDELLRVM